MSDNVTISRATALAALGIANGEAWLHNVEAVKDNLREALAQEPTALIADEVTGAGSIYSAGDGLCEDGGKCGIGGYCAACRYSVEAEREACHQLRQTIKNPYTEQGSAHAYDMAILDYGKAIRERGNG